MLLKHTVVTVVFASALAPLPLFSQENAAYKTEIGIQATLPLVKDTNASGIQESSSITFGLLADYRFFFNKHSGAELSYGYTRSTHTYGLSVGPLGINNNTDEVSAAYVFRFPVKRWKPFVLAGAGALIFDPRSVVGASTQARAGYLYGAGVDFTLKQRIFLRTEYRGVFYNSPTFNVGALNGLDRFTHLAEPSIGFGYRF